MSSPIRAPIPVVCDRCRAEALSDEDPFEAFGDLLDFAPVPRLKHRPDGWTDEVQRAYIAALSLAGSERAACRAVGKSAFGVQQLLASPGSEGFAAAREEALAIAADERSRRLREGLRAVASEQSGWRPPDPPWAKASTRRPALAPPPEPDGEGYDHGGELTPQEEKLRFDLLLVIVRKYVLKLEAERRCRLEGRIAEADFYIRQVTMLEVALDVVSGDGMAALRDARRGGDDLLHIAETEMSKILDRARGDHFAACGDPPRPEYPPRHLLVERDGHSIEPVEGPLPPEPETWQERRQRQEEQYARDAKAHVEWEAEARRDYERRRDSGAAS